MCVDGEASDLSSNSTSRSVGPFGTWKRLVAGRLTPGGSLAVGGGDRDRYGAATRSLGRRARAGGAIVGVSWGLDWVSRAELSGRGSGFRSWRTIGNFSFENVWNSRRSLSVDICANQGCVQQERGCRPAPHIPAEGGAFTLRPRSGNEIRCQASSPCIRGAKPGRHHPGNGKRASALTPDDQGISIAAGFQGRRSRPAGR